jgi:2-polyprenyl-6-methoxyphenol hydroxylase-like FAD-dependent oxidoreductase
MTHSTAPDVDVVIVGAGPTGLMLAIELGLAGVRPLVLERHPQILEIARAGGLNGQILELLHYRGLRHRFEAASTRPSPPLRLPFGGLHVDFTRMAVPPMHLLMIAQPQLERVLAEIALELGAEIRRGHEAIELTQDDDVVVADVRGPNGAYHLNARYLVGCDGASSRIRKIANVPFTGTTYPEVNRLAQVTVPDSVTVLENGDIAVAGQGTIAFGFKQTDRGSFALGSTSRGVMGLFTSVDERTEYDDDEPMTLTELRDSIRRVLGFEIPLGEAIRLTRFTFHARQADRYRDGRIFLAGDAAHLFPTGGVGLNAGMIDSINLGWKLAAAVHGNAPDAILDTYDHERRAAGERTMLHAQAQVALRRGHDPAADALRKLFQELLADEQPLRRIGALIAATDIRYPAHGPNHHALTGTFAPDLALRTSDGTTSVAELMRVARPVFLDLADREDLRTVASGWSSRVEIHSAQTDLRAADAMLIRPDGHIAWAGALDEPFHTAAIGLRDALSRWFGARAA